MKLSQAVNKRILFSPLNWGMGHVSRSISLLNELNERGNTLFIACSEMQKAIYKEYLTDVTYLHHEGYPFEFKGKGQFGLDLLIGFPDLQMRLDNEKNEVADYCDEFKIDLILSDHRYGFRNDKVRSVFISHQTSLPTKWYHLGVNAIHQKLMDRFDAIWIMDSGDHKLSGKLSYYDGDKEVDFIGPYSRFSMYSEDPVKDITQVLIASGPDVYAQKFINERGIQGDIEIVICAPTLDVPPQLKRFSGSWREQDEIIRRSKKIISRSGYSTIMDLEFLEVPFELIPTPGQEEQKYLAEFHKS